MDTSLNIKEDSFSVTGSKTLCFSDNRERFLVFTDSGGVFGDQITQVLSFSEFLENSVLFVANDLKRFRVKVNFDEESWLHFDTKSHRDTEAFLQQVVEWADPANIPDIYFAAEVESPVLAQIKENYDADSEESSSLLSMGGDVLFRNDCVPLHISVQEGRVRIQLMNYLPSELPLSKLIINLTGSLLECRNTLLIGDILRLHGFRINLVSEGFAAKYLMDLGLSHAVSHGEGGATQVGLIGQVHVEGIVDGAVLEKKVYDALIEETTLTILKQETGEAVSSFSLVSPGLAIDGTAQEFLISRDSKTTIKITSESEEFLLAIFNNRPTRRRAYVSSNIGPFVATTTTGELVRLDADQGKIAFSSGLSFPADGFEAGAAYKITATGKKFLLTSGEHELIAELPTLEGIAAKAVAAHSRLLLQADFRGYLGNLILLEQRYLAYHLFGKLAEIQLLIANTTDSDPFEAVALARGVQERSTFLSIMVQLIEARTQEMETTLYRLPAFLVERDKEFLEALGLDASFDFLEEMLKYQDATEKCRGLMPHLLNIHGLTGVGKTEVTIAFTDYLCGPEHLHRFDMSEFQNQSSVGLLLGSSSSDIGMLGRALNKTTHGTLLFDEIEKAHPLVLDLFLQILDAGRITLANGETRNLNNYFTVFTSNIGAGEAMRMESSAFATIERTVLRRVDQVLRPELVARINEKLVFNRLPYAVQRDICELMIGREVERLNRLGHTFSVTPEIVEKLVREGFHRTLGARPMRNTVDRFLQEVISQELLAKG